MNTQTESTPMSTLFVFIWAALSLLLIAFTVEPRTAEAWAAVICGVLLLLFMGWSTPRR